MLKQILISSVILLTACGGSNSDAPIAPTDPVENKDSSPGDENTNDDGGETSTPIPRGSIDYTTDLSHLKGADIEPAINTINVTDGDEIFINSELNNTLMPFDSHSFTFTPVEDENVLVILSGESYVTGLEVNGHIRSGEDASGLPLVNGVFNFLSPVAIDVVAGTTYTITLNLGAIDDTAVPYALKLVQANRQSLDLADNEFYLSFDMNLSSSCTDGSRPISVFQGTMGKRINFVDGYYGLAYGVGNIYLDYDGSYFYYQMVSSSTGNSPEDGDYTMTTEIDTWFVLTEDTGIVAGNEVLSTGYVYADQGVDSYSCSQVIEYNSRFIF